MTTERSELINTALTALQEMIWHGRIRFQHLARQHRLTSPQASVLLFIDRNGPETTMGECADALQISASSITSIVNRLVGLKLIQRGDGRDDRRVVSASLTTTGQNVVRTISAQRRESFAQLLEDVDDANMAHFNEVLGTVRRSMTT
jgi:DNA-binding MarR family transcriptional regulator